MVRNEYQKYIGSRFNFVIICILVIVAVICFYGTYLDQQDLIRQLAHPSPDFNSEAAQNLLQGYNGFTFVGNYLFSTDFYVLTVVLMILGFSAVIGDVTYKNLHSGYGNMLVLRSGYAKYIKDIMAAQCRYITTFIWCYFSLLTIIAIIIWPVNSSAGITMNITQNAGVMNVIFYFLIHLILLSVYLCILFAITSLSTILLKNKFLIQALPLLLHAVPMLAAATLGNINQVFAKLFTIINPETYIFSVKWFLIMDQPIAVTVAMACGVPIILMAIGAVLYNRNCIQYQREYL